MFRLSHELNYMIPPHFGLWGDGQPRPSHCHDATALSIDYETDGELLAQFIPERFAPSRPVVNVQFIMLRKVDWLGGGGYNLIQIGTPVVYAHGGERLEGVYVLVIWENSATPIMTGREQTGMPKIFADIEDLHQIGNHVYTNASYEGSSFLKIQFEQGREFSSQELATLNSSSSRSNTFGWRYIPNIGRPGAALSHATLFPMDSTTSAAWTGTGTVEWGEPVVGQYPSQFGAVQALNKLPIQAYGDCMMARCSIALRNDLARQLP